MRIVLAMLQSITPPRAVAPSALASNHALRNHDTKLIHDLVVVVVGVFGGGLTHARAQAHTNAHTNTHANIESNRRCSAYL